MTNPHHENLIRIHVREATPQDIPALLSIKKAFEPLDDLDDSHSRDYYSYLIHQGIFLVAEQIGSVQGFIACEDNGTICYVADAGVASLHQGHGIFSALARELETRITQRGFRRVLCHVKETNTLMMQILEQKLNFKQGDRYVLFYRTT